MRNEKGEDTGDINLIHDFRSHTSSSGSGGGSNGTNSAASNKVRIITSS